MPEFREERPTLADGTTYDPTPAFHRPAYRYIRATDRLPSTDTAYENVDPLIRVKLFDPVGNWTWYVAGYDPDRRVAYGAVDGFAFEVGDFWMPELTTRRGRPFGLPIERDLWFEPRLLSVLRAQPRAER
jgi:hypothetical protein